MIRTSKKGNRTIEVANPDLAGAGIKIESPFFVDLGRGIPRRQNLNANVGCAREDDWILVNFGSTGSRPGDIDRLDAVGSRHRALRQCLTVRQERIQDADDVTLAARVSESGRRAHEDVTVPIRLDAIRELRKKGIGQNLGPKLEILLGLRVEIRELDCDRHR